MTGLAMAACAARDENSEGFADLRRERRGLLGRSGAAQELGHRALFNEARDVARFTRPGAIARNAPLRPWQSIVISAAAETKSVEFCLLLTANGRTSDYCL